MLLADANLLLDCGAAVDATDSYGHTPLLLAARQGLDAICRRLLSLNADPGARTTLRRWFGF